MPDALERHILQIKRENPSYGKQRIASILSHAVGAPVCANTVAAVLKRHPAPPFSAAQAGSRWRSFVNAVCGRAATLDFKVVNDVFGRQVYILSVLHLARRRLLVCNATHNPTSDWITQQLREAFPFDTAPKYLFLDNDPLFANAVATTLPAMGITPVRIMPGRPQMNAHIERFNRTLTTELLDQIPILGAHQLIRLLHEYRRFYNTARPHQANGGEPPDHMPAPANDTGVPDAIASIPWLGGLHHEYRRAA